MGSGSSVCSFTISLLEKILNNYTAQEAVIGVRLLHFAIMFIVRFLAALALASGLSLGVAENVAPLRSNFEIRNAPGASSADTMELIRRSLTDVALKRATDKVYKHNVTLDTSWKDTTIFMMGVYVFALCSDNLACRLFLMFNRKAKNQNTEASAYVAVTCTTVSLIGTSYTRSYMAFENNCGESNFKR